MFKALKKHRFILEELVKRDFKKKYKRSILGIGWSILSPLLTLLVMNLVFSYIFGNEIEHYIIYLFCGNLVYSYFNESTSQGMTSLMSNANIFTKINVPKYLFLLSKNLQTLINFGLTLIVFFIFCIFDGIAFTWAFFALIIPILCLVIFNIGIGMILSALFVFFRDIQYLWSVFTLLLMYMSAIFYNVAEFPEHIQALFHINPVFVYIKYFRVVVLDGAVPGIGLHLLAVGYAIVAIGIGALIYKTKNHRFLYYV